MMELTNDFSVPRPVETVWAALLDVERVAPCLPGASVDRVEGDDIHGGVRVKLGPITMRYQGVMTFTEKDEQAHRAVMTARAQETRGGGSVNASITAVLTGNGDSTQVNVVTDLDVTGKPAQFGRGVMADVSKQLVDQFAANLARELESEGATPLSAATPETLAATAGAGATSSSAARPSAGGAAAAELDSSLNVLALLGGPARRLLPPVAAGLLVGLVLGRITKRSGRSAPRHIAYTHLCPYLPQQ
jgi:carbon monoxide dehydrogenase subunit G